MIRTNKHDIVICNLTNIARMLDKKHPVVSTKIFQPIKEGIEGLGDHPKSGRPRRLTTEEDSKLIALARQAPPGRLVTQRDGTMVALDEEGEARWSFATAQLNRRAKPWIW